MAKRPSKAQRISEDLRTWIVNGAYAPGERLPTWRNLELTFQAATNTIRRAMQPLNDDGFVEARGRQGTFVSRYPPHLCHFALALPDLGGPPGYHQQALTEAAKALDSDSCHWRIYRYPAWGKGQTLCEELKQDIEAFRLGGVVFLAGPHFIQCPTIAAHGTPTVYLDLRARSGTPRLHLDYHALIEDAIACFAARDCRKLAVLMTPQQEPWGRKQLQKELAAQNLSTEPCWQQTALPEQPATTRSIIGLLLRGPPEQRPDGLFIMDDTLLPAAATALAESALTVPDDLPVISHANVPILPPTPVPVVRLGFDGHQILRTAHEQLLALHKGEPVRPVTRIAPVFADETPTGD